MQSGPTLSVKPAMADAKVRTEATLAGPTVGGSSSLLPPTPSAMTMEMHIGIDIARPNQLMDL